MKRIAILASGEGTNAEAIARYFENNPDVEVSLLICNRKAAGVFERMRPFGVESHYFPKAEWVDNGAANVLQLFAEHHIDLVVLAGFLAIIPDPLIRAYEGRMINIHPSLLPKFGGVGMYGSNVHRAVLDAGEKESGITIHQISSVVDGGEIVFQARCAVEPDDTPDTLAARVHVLEHTHFPRVVAELLAAQ
ncbi:MAG: phosphoribosylglycinamide formyltransferase [Bacteroidaceae bacterium]|nr:phosphoribosylglycinamide formyltransferase [Bacteroidaceae bacterium]